MSLLAIAQTMLNAASVDETKVQTPDAFKRSGCTKVVHVIEWGTGVSSGVVEIEAADDPDYAGTWAGLGTITYDSGSPKLVTYTTDGAYGAFQHRVSTVVAGGTVTSRIRGVTE